MHLSFLSIKAFRRIIHEIYYDREIVHFIKTPFRTRFQIMILQCLRVNIDLLENPSAKKKTRSRILSLFPTSRTWIFFFLLQHWRQLFLHEANIKPGFFRHSPYRAHHLQFRFLSTQFPAKTKKKVCFSFRSRKGYCIISFISTQGDRFACNV